MSKTTCCIGLKKVFRTGTLRETYLGVYPFRNWKWKGRYSTAGSTIIYLISLLCDLCKEAKKGWLDEARRAWNESSIYHFIGKDIVYHHYLFLPAVRMGIDYEYKLPDYMPTRGHLLLYDKKISKSRDWYIGLRDFLKRNNPDYLRFYLALVT